MHQDAHLSAIIQLPVWPQQLGEAYALVSGVPAKDQDKF